MLMIMFISELKGRTALMVASWGGNLEVVMELLTAGAKADAQDPVSTHKEYYQRQ